MLNVEQIRAEFRQLRDTETYVGDKTGSRVIEIAGAQFIADEDVIFGTANLEYIANELVWYDNQSLNVNDIPNGAPTIWKQVADSQGFINSNYGYLIYSDANNNQYQHTVAELKANPESRRAQMIYTRPDIWTEYNLNGRNDFICTNTVQYLIRNNQLNAYVQMRSNDAVYGYKNDVAWQRVVLQRLAEDLDITPGFVSWSATSLHIYERHWHLIK